MNNRFTVSSCQNTRFLVFSIRMEKGCYVPKTLSLACLLLAIASPSSLAAVTQFTFLNGMSGSNEVSMNASTGTATINLLQFDDSVGPFGTLSISLAFSGLGSNAAAAHVHGFSNATTNSDVLQGLAVTAATSGTITGSWAPTSSLQVDGLFDGLTYINLHSDNVGTGELRGQLVAVPEPGVFGLLGITGIALLRRRTRR